MTYREIQTILNHQLTPEQLDLDASIAVISASGVEIVEICDFVDPNDDIFQNEPEFQDVRDAVYLNEIEDSILDEGHPYMIVITQ